MLTDGALASVGLSVGIASWLLVGMVRRHALRTELLDRPSARGSHLAPTPRGGGLGLMAALLSGIAMCLVLDPSMASWSLLATLLCVAVVAAVGWADDRTPLPVRPRLVAHFAAASAIAYWAAGASGPFGVTGVAAICWWFFWTVAAINVTNFVDGIDGLVGSQMIVWGSFLALASGGSRLAAVVGVCLAAASAGFLAWNWPPARIFLGDVGSGALGAIVVVGGVVLHREAGRTVEMAFLPLLPLYLDATATLLGRAYRGERVWQAHRQHLYQRLAAAGWGHARVALLYAGLALLGCAVALAAPRFRVVAAVAYVMLVTGLGIWLNRGLRHRTAALEGRP